MDCAPAVPIASSLADNVSPKRIHCAPAASSVSRVGLACPCPKDMARVIKGTRSVYRFTGDVALGNPRGFLQAGKEDQEIAEACSSLIKLISRYVPHMGVSGSRGYSIRYPRSEPGCMTRPVLRARSTSHTLAVRGGCTKIPLAAVGAQEDETILCFGV